MELQVHKIRKQYVEVEFNGTESDAVILQNSLSGLYYDQIMAALEDVFKRYAPSRDHLTIERLDIDVGTLDLDSLESTLSERIIQALEQSLQKLSVSAPLLHSRQTDTVTFTVKTEGDSLGDAFIFFLNNGTLPWSFHLPSGSTLEEAVYKLLKEPENFGATPELIRGKVVQVLTSATAQKRLIHQFSSLFLETLFQLISPERTTELKGFLQLSRRSEFLAAEAKQPEQLLWEHTFACLASGNPLTEETFTSEIKVRTTEGESILEAFIFFLKNGTLPWSFHLFSGSTCEEVVYKLLKEPEQFGVALERIRGAVLKVLTLATARKRLIHQFSPLFLETLLLLISTEGASVLKGFLPLFSGQLEQLLWEDAFACLASGNSLTEERIISAIRVALTLPVFRHLSLDSRFERYCSDVSVIQKVTGLPLPPILLDDHRTETNVNEKSTLHQKAQDNDEADSLRTIEHPEAKTGIYIVLAGLVLLHPFLPQLFRALAVADDEKLLQPTRALHLLYFLVTGESIAPEYELVLPKILCNISLDATVELEIALTVSEQEEAEALLSAVIFHWEVLKNTSIDGLREAFLKRSGKLSQRSDGEWLLQVESKSYDLLLEQLPWGISMIKLPWMSKMLKVEWI